MHLWRIIFSFENYIILSKEIKEKTKRNLPHPRSDSFMVSNSKFTKVWFEIRGMNLSTHTPNIYFYIQVNVLELWDFNLENCIRKLVLNVTLV